MFTLKRLVLLLAVIATAMGVVLSRHAARGHFAELQRLETHRDALSVEWGRLQLEQATWAEASRVEQHARNELGLVTKAPEQVVVIIQ